MDKISGVRLSVIGYPKPCKCDSENEIKIELSNENKLFISLVRDINVDYGA